jgi:hypothetical protein
MLVIETGTATPYPGDAMRFAVVNLVERTVLAVESTMLAATDRFYAVTTGRDRITSATVLPIADGFAGCRLEVVGDLSGLSVIPALDRVEDRTMRELMAAGIDIGYRG